MPDCQDDTCNETPCCRTCKRVVAYLRENGQPIDLTASNFTWNPILLNLGEPHEVMIKDETEKNSKVSFFTEYFIDNIEVNQQRFHENGPHNIFEEKR